MLHLRSTRSAEGNDAENLQQSDIVILLSLISVAEVAAVASLLPCRFIDNPLETGHDQIHQAPFTRLEETQPSTWSRGSYSFALPSIKESEALAGHPHNVSMPVE